MGLAIIYDSQKKYDKAKEYYQKVLKINPRFAPAQNNLAYLYAETGGNIDEALTFSPEAQRNNFLMTRISPIPSDGSITKRISSLAPLSI